MDFCGALQKKKVIENAKLEIILEKTKDIFKPMRNQKIIREK